MRRAKVSVAALLLMMGTGSAYATTVGYSNEKIQRTNVFSVGSSTTQGQMIRLSREKLQRFKGKAIDYAEFVVGTKYTDGGTMHVFITASPDAAPLREATLTIDKPLAKCRWTLDEPYVVTGDEEQLYIGYTAEVDTNRKLLISDGSYDIEGCNFAMKDGEWTDTYGMNRGSALISFNVDGAPDYTDVIMARSSLDGYFKAGNKYDMAGHFVNAGTTAVTSFDAVVRVDASESTLHFGDISVEPKDSYTFQIDGMDSSDEGQQQVSVRITNVNGGGQEDDTSDNTLGADVFFYPHDMERTLLVETFTGQDCSNCPSGHQSVENAVDYFTDESIVEVAHHVGYQPDMFTMSEDNDYRFYYGNSQSTYAPAVMVNRNADNTVSSVAPVSNASYNIARQLIYHASQSKPYVSLNLATGFDESTRRLKVHLDILPHTQVPSENMLLNVFLVQDGIQAYQSNGGSNYTHNRVFRGTVTGNSWGIVAYDLTPGKVTSWDGEIDLPEKIHSSYWTDDMIEEVETTSGTKQMYGGKYNLDQVDIEAVPENMTVVAYVGEYDTSDNTKNIIYNCCEAPLGGSYRQAGFSVPAGIESVQTGESRGSREAQGIYSLDGRKMPTDTVLPKGIYIVKTASGSRKVVL